MGYKKGPVEVVVREVSDDIWQKFLHEESPEHTDSKWSRLTSGFRDLPVHNLAHKTVRPVMVAHRLDVSEPRDAGRARAAINKFISSLPVTPSWRYKSKVINGVIYFCKVVG